MEIFNVTNSTPLCEIMERNKSDKGGLNLSTSWHNYTPIYYSLFKDIRLNSLRIFELGLGTNNINIPSHMGVNGRPGASLYGWSEFFPNSQIYGADIDSDILFSNERIKTYYCDQTNTDSIKNLWNNQLLSNEIDIIIEDGLHEFSANVCFFENSIHKLSKGGYYIIEDVWNHEIKLFASKIEEWKNKHKDLLINILVLPSSVNNNDNNLIIFKRVS
jgi:hypothetical protein